MLQDGELPVLAADRPLVVFSPLSGDVAPEQPMQRMLSLRLITERLPVRRLSASGVQRLTRSMQASGFLENFPLIVAPLSHGTFQLIEGNHRYEVALALGLVAVPCVVKPNLSESERYALAWRSNRAAETVVPSTLVTYAEFVWARSEEGKTLEEIAEMMDWGLDKVKKYSTLKQIDAKVWEIIVPTFEAFDTQDEEEAALPKCRAAL